jgi:ubiquinol-cytochrome c reductase cytochrome b/c1 subunit
VVMLRLLALHQHCSNNPLGIDRKGPQDSIPFHPYYTIKDMFGLSVFLIVFALFVFYMPNVLGDPQNYIPANPLQTPPEIVPEWYFLPYYAILRSIPNKLIGVCAMFGSILTLFLLPWLDTSRIRSAFFRPVYKWVFWILVVDCFVLGYVGAHRPEGWYVIMGRIATIYYYAHFYVLFPLIGLFERPLPLPTSITAAVLARRGGGVAAAAPMEKH